MPEIQASKSLYKSTTRPKGDKTRHAIIKGAEKELLNCGIEDLSYQAIADHTKITRQLVRHHFPDKKNLLLEVALDVREEYQKLCIEEMKKAENAVDLFLAYIDCALNWANTHPKHLSIWMQFLRVCTQSPDFKKAHDDLAKLGHLRIEEILKQGQQEGVFACGGSKMRAKLIQITIAGGLLTMATENLETKPTDFISEIKHQCLIISQTPKIEQTN